MSLLLEALKKAERAKRENHAEQPPSIPADKRAQAVEAAPVAVEPATNRAEPGFPEISLPEEVEPPVPPPALRGKPEAKTEPVLSLDLPEPAPTPAPAITPKPAPGAPPSTEAAGGTAKKQEAAKKLLAARQDRPKRNLKLPGGMLIVSVALGAAAAYYYWQATIPSAPAPAGRSRPQAAMPPAPQVAQRTEPSAATPPPATPGPVVAEALQTEVAGLPPGLQNLSVPKEPVEKPVTPAPPKKVRPADMPPNGHTPTGASQGAWEKPARKKVPPADETIKASVGTSPGFPDSGIKIRRDAGESRLDPLLAGAYQAFMAGDSVKAQADYRKALQQAPNSRDALLGLAAIAATRGQTQEASGHYLHVLQLDPKDAAAQAGLIGLRGHSDPTVSESRLKTLLAQHPDAGYLHFALGNLYAQQARWPEAQEAYFNAFHNDSGNADYAFNLAVSLDHLDQRKPALAYYRRALALAKERPAGFDSEQLKKRVHELQAPD